MTKQQDQGSEPAGTPEPPAEGWRVLDPDGNVVDSGPGIVLVAADNMADPPADQQAEPAADTQED